MRGNRKWKLIKEDIDLWKANQDFAAVPFAKGHSLFSYIINLTYLFFLGQKHCFRTLFYFRLGKWHILLSWVFRPQYKDTYIWSSNVEGGGIFFAHPYSTVLNCEHIGYGCSFSHNTTFGNKWKNGKLGRPYLESHIQVGANAVVIGDVHIGNNVKIGAGAVVTKSIPDNCVVVGNPARIIMKDGKRVNIPI